MSSAQVPALAQLFRNCGFSWATADELCNQIEALNLNGARSDDVAAALFKWRRKGEVAALTQIRRKAMNVLVGNGSETSVADVVSCLRSEDEDETQPGLFGSADERARLGSCLAMRNGR